MWNPHQLELEVAMNFGAWKKIGVVWEMALLLMTQLSPTSIKLLKYKEEKKLVSKVVVDIQQPLIIC